MHILSILRIVGILVMCFSCTMLLPAFVALLYGDGGGKAFIQSFVMSAIAGAILWWACHHHKEELRCCLLGCDGKFRGDPIPFI